MPLTRRGLLAAAGAAPFLAEATPEPGSRGERRFEVSLSPEGLRADPELLPTVAAAGVHAVWLTGFMYGYWPYAMEETLRFAKAARGLGMEAHMITVPLGHPGDSLGSMSGAVPLTPPARWRMGVAADGRRFSGTSLHPPATGENVEALRRAADSGFRRIFVDDDFRLAQAPGTVGGCFCDEHRRGWLRAHGYTDGRWEELLADIAARRLTRLVQEWIDAACTELSASYLAQRAAARPARLGNMVMYMGSEQAGIRLEDYRSELFRVGEGHFGDGDFGTLKGKMNELYSALFHRRFARPELAYSETTAYPAHALSAQNMAAKLAVSTLTDVRNTCFMSGLTPFPKTHWATLAVRMRHEAAIHRQVAGHRAVGPVKHWWGRAGRHVGDANPFSLSLAIGLPFEVCSKEPTKGWVFLGDQDAAHAPMAPSSDARIVVARAGAACGWPGARGVAEALPDLFRLRREVLAANPQCPHVVEEQPATLAWYPTLGKALVWNLEERACTLTVRAGAVTARVSLPALGTALVGLAAPRPARSA